MGVTVDNRTYNFAFRNLNRVARVAEGLRLTPSKLHADRVLSRATEQAGFTDFGHPSYREGLDQIIDASNHAPLTPLAKIIAARTYIEAATTRLKLVHLQKRSPEVTKLPIERPIFVLGFPRSGTTVLQNLLSLCPTRRALQFWELTRPIPELDDPRADAQQRIHTTQSILKIAYLASPEMRRVHEIEATSYEECWPLFCPSFSVLNWDLGAGISDYGDWLMNSNMVHTYTEYRELLQVLVARDPSRRLILKCPEHLWFLDALLEVFPDAAIVWAHRDPYHSIASYCSLISMQWRTMYGILRPTEIGAHISNRFAEGVDRAMAVRARVGEERFFDVRFQDLIQDQAGTIEAIGSRFGFQAPARADMQAYLQAKRGDARGEHRYTPEMYGLNQAEINERFHPYTRRFLQTS